MCARARQPAGLRKARLFTHARRAASQGKPVKAVRLALLEELLQLTLLLDRHGIFGKARELWKDKLPPGTVLGIQGFTLGAQPCAPALWGAAIEG